MDLDERPRVTALSYIWEQSTSWKSTSYNVFKGIMASGDGSDPTIERILSIADEMKKGHIDANLQLADGTRQQYWNHIESET